MLLGVLVGQGLHTATVSAERERGHSANLTCPAKEDKEQANTAAVHIYFYVNKCIYK